MPETITWSAVATLLGAASTCITITAAAVYFVGCLKTSIDLAVATIGGLKDSVYKLTASVDRLDRRVEDHNMRIDRLENSTQPQPK